jgi:hypothetical protein
VCGRCSIRAATVDQGSSSATTAVTATIPQDNLLDSLLPGLGQLVHLDVINLDGNPLGARLVAVGPTLGEVWQGLGGEAGPAGQLEAGGCSGGESSSGPGRCDRDKGTPLVAQRAAAACTAAEEVRLRRCTKRVMQHLQALQVIRQNQPLREGWFGSSMQRQAAVTAMPVCMLVGRTKAAGQGVLEWHAWYVSLYTLVRKGGKERLALSESPLICRQSPEQALAVKRAQLELLQARARDKLARAARVAEPEILEACRVRQGCIWGVDRGQGARRQEEREPPHECCLCAAASKIFLQTAAARYERVPARSELRLLLPCILGPTRNGGTRFSAPPDLSLSPGRPSRSTPG